MKLSVVVVNHNQCSLLKQTLVSLFNASLRIDHEVIVVDNASSDNSVNMIKEGFPQVHIIANETAAGVSKASNQAIKISSGEYVLVINPDIFCCKDSLDKMVGFMDMHEDTAGISVRMLSPQGRFLPESVYGLTRAWRTFFKLIGFDKYFSKTRLKNHGSKDWVEEFQVKEVDILNDSCILLRRSALNDTGLFDERFSMYGHHIDLSYRLRLAGYKNFYFPKTYVINTERSKLTKFNWSYVKNFYGAMILFAIKYLIKTPELHLPRISQLFPSLYGAK